jgi:hypothetical protein
MADQCLYLPNDQPLLPPLEDVPSHLGTILGQIVTEYPPKQSYDPDTCLGGWAGPTSIAYLFLHVSAAFPDLVVDNKSAIQWAREYLSGDRGHAELGSICGLLEEKTTFEAVRAAVTKDIADVKEFLLNIPIILAKGYISELTNGKAGILYMLRMLRHWVPDSAPLLEEPAALITESILAEGPDWITHKARYIGVGHGDIGIITQVVLTTPSVAPRVEPWLVRLLDWQLENGNWDKKQDEPPGGKSLVQFCHGAPGFVLSLVAMRPYFPALIPRIDAAVEKGREVTWKEGILTKEPNLCHGTLGNAM